MEKIKAASRPGIILLGVLLFTAAAILLLRMVLAVSHLAETGGVSVNVVYGIVRVLEGLPLYSNPEQAPFAIIQYMPLHYRIVQALALVLNLEGNPHAIVALNRLVCLAIDLGSCFVLWRLFTKHFRTGRLWGGILTLVLFTSIPAVAYARVDNLYLFFFIATVVVMVKALQAKDLDVSSGNKLLIAAGALAAGSLLSKQTGLFLIAYCGIYLLFLQRDLRSALRFSAGLLITLIVAGPLLIQSNWHDLYLNVIDGVRNGTSLTWFKEVILKNFFLKYSFLIAAGLLTGFHLLTRERNSKAGLFLGTGIGFTFFVATMSAFKAGSGTNYFLDFLVLFLIGAAWLNTKGHIALPALAPYAIALLPFYMIASANDRGWGDLPGMRTARKNYRLSEQAANYILTRTEKDQWALALFHKENHMNLLLGGKALFPCREVALQYTRPLGVFHFRAFGDLIRNGKVPYLVTHRKKPPVKIADENLSAYVPDTLFGPFRIYRWDPVAADSIAASATQENVPAN
jgi:hypothetical protein